MLAAFSIVSVALCKLYAKFNIDFLRKNICIGKTDYFLACTTERFFRIDRGQEQLHYVTDVAAEAVYVLDEDTVQQSEGQAGPSQIMTSQEIESTQIHLPRYTRYFCANLAFVFFFFSETYGTIWYSDERPKDMPAVTKEEQRSIPNESKGIQEQKQPSRQCDKKADSQDAKNSLDVSPTEDKDIKSNSLINRESLKQDSSVATAQSHQIDRPLTFIR